MKIDDEFCKRLPLSPSQELIDFVNKKPKFNIQCLVYRVGYENGRKVAMCKCTACGKEFSQEWLPNELCPQTYSNCTFGFRNSLTNEAVCGKTTTMCPHCASPVNVYHISDFGKHAARIEIAVDPFLTVQVLDGALCLLVWSVSRYVRKDGTVNNVITATESNIYTKKNKKVIIPYSNWHVLHKHRTAIGRVSSSNIYPFKDELLIGTDFENAKLEKYFFSGEAYPSLYAQLYRKYPQVENLVTSGLSFYLNERQRAVYSSYYGYSAELITGIDFSEVKPSKMLGLTKDEIREFIASPISYQFLCFYKENKEQYSLSDVAFLSKVFNTYDLQKIKEQKEKALKIARYIVKQRTYCSIVDYSYLRDYWKMLEDLKIKITEHNKFPHKLHNAHDSLSKRIKEKKSKDLEEKYKLRFDLLNQLSYEADGLLIRPCKTDSELFNEGKVLDHCVYTYATRHCDGKTAIFFVRKAKSPNTPYYTLEFDEKGIKIRQNRGYKNNIKTPKDPAVTRFEEKWLDYVKKLKEKENGKQKRVNSARSTTAAGA